MIKKLTALSAFFMSASAFAQEHAATAGMSDKGLYAIGAAIVLGLAAFGGTAGQGKVGAAAMEGIARNPQSAKVLNTPMILTLALIESLVILSFLIAFFLQAKL
jgi:F-type H+-transporting ATPase subunit c